MMENERRVAILDSWRANAANWISTIENREIESRKAATDAAILQVIAEIRPATALDIGCGEGWLTRALSVMGVQAMGVDVVPELVEYARRHGNEEYLVAPYGLIAGGVLSPRRFDLIVINFALLDRVETEALIGSLPNLLKVNGSVVIQTLHPLSRPAGSPYQDGWVPGSWKGMKRDFVKPYDWYYRTFSGWMRLFEKAGLRLLSMREPMNTQRELPYSVIFILGKSRR